MVKRAIAHCDWQGVVLLEKLLDGRVDPRVPYRLEETSLNNERWFCIAPEGNPPQLPADG
jgi:hypothetical protein